MKKLDNYMVKKVCFLSLLFFFLLLISLSLSYNIDKLLLHKPVDFFNIFVHIKGLSNINVAKFFFCGVIISSLIMLHIIFSQVYLKFRSNMRTIAGGITIPQAFGQGQYGTAEFMADRNIEKFFTSASYANIHQIKKGGLFLGMNKQKSHFYYVSDDTHSCVIGATRSGKTRCLVLQTICITAISGESMVISDPKSELYLYTKEFLEEKGYEIIVIDFINPNKSNQYNFLQPIIDAVNEGKESLAITRTNDLVMSIVSASEHGEAIWTEGERSIISSAVLAVVVDNKNNPQYQNLTNVYQFLENMCKPDEKGKMPIADYIESLDDGHPAKALAGISELAPSRMRGSFYVSALVTLKLFMAPEIYDMTHITDFDLYATSNTKRAIFLVLPDHKSTYYSIASLFVYQHYQTLVDESNKRGSRLSNRVNFILDEFGNFSKIPDLTKLITVGGGRGIRYNLFLQDFNQLKKIYGDEDAKIIRSNCETWVYLQSDDKDTLEEFSGKLGKYTIKTPNLSASTGGQASASYSLTGRELLMPDEVKKIRRPYQLVTSRNLPAILFSPDISKTVFNKWLLMGSEENNIDLLISRNKQRETRKEVLSKDIPIWKPWEKSFQDNILRGFFKQMNKQINKTIIGIAVSANLMLLKAYAATGSSIANSKIGIGINRMLSDIQPWLISISIVIGGVFVVYGFIRKSAADEHEAKMWNKRIVSAICCTIGATLAPFIIQLVLGYFV